LKDIVLYCKSYSRDFLRIKRLLASIEKYNVEEIPFYISTPKCDRQLLIDILGNAGYQWVADEDIASSNPKTDLKKYRLMPGGLSQQIIKSEFWRLKFSENYLCIDSDGIFLKDFVRADFLTTGGIPYTVLHQNKDFFQLATNLGYLKVERDLRTEAERVQALFGRVGPAFYCAPAPFIWSAKVWESLDRECLTPRNISLWDFIAPEYPETLIYGEALLKYRAIPLIAIEPLFRTYHYDWQYQLMKRLGETEEKIKQNYLGVIYQSAWDLDLAYGKSRKSFPSRMLKHLKQFARKIQGYWS